jgi:hypothetical protein
MKMLKVFGIKEVRLCALTSAIVALSAAHSAFAEDAYIQSYGAQSVNTGYHASGKTKISVDFQMTEIKSNNDCVIGHYKAAGQFTLLIYCPKTTEIYAEAKDGAHAGTAKMFKAGSTTEYAGSDLARHTIVIDAPGRRSDMYDASGNHEAHYEFPNSWTYNKTSTWPLLLFAASDDANGTPLQPVKAKIYGVKIWETENGVETLIHNYVPAEKYGYAGFYDTVDNQFFGQQETTGTLLSYGGDVMSLGEDPYIENDGSAYSAIDTRYFPNNRTKVEVDFQETEIVSGDCVFGHYASDYTLLIYRPTSDGHYWLVAKDGTYSGCALSPQVSSDTRRHTAVIDIPNRHVEMRAPDGGIQGSAELSSKTEWSWNFSTVNNPLMMFGHSTDAYGNSNQRVKARIYGVRIYENANSDGSGEWTKVHDFTPYLRKGVPGFKDTVTGKYVSGGNIVAGGNPPEEDDTDPYIDTGTDNLVMSFDTGYYVSSNTCIVCDYMPLKQKAEQQFVFEAGDGTSANNSGKMYMRLYANGNAGNGGISYACGSDQYVVIHPDGTPANGKQIWFAPNVRRTVTLDAYHGKVEMAMNGERVSTKALAATSRLPDKSASTLKIFSSSGGGDHATMARLYSFQIYEGGVRVRDYRPYVKGGVVGLRDIVGDGGFITASNAANSLKLSGGGGIEGRTDAYIQNDGTTILDLGYKASMKTRVEYDFQNLLLGSSKVFFGAWSAKDSSGNDINIGNLRYCCWNDGGKIKFIFSGNTGGTQNPTDISTDYGRHTAIMDMKNRALGFVTDGVTNNVAVKGTFSADGKDESLLNMGAFAALTGGLVSKSRIYAVRIYEDNKLIHEFLPYKNGDTVSLYDTKTGNVATKATASMKWPTIGGKGVDGAEKWIVEPQGAVTLTKNGEPKTITANAAGAVSYKWTKNCEAIEGGENGELTVSWEKRSAGNTVDTYTVTPVYNVFGTEVEGAPKDITVTNEPLGLIIIVR